VVVSDLTNYAANHNGSRSAGKDRSNNPSGWLLIPVSIFQRLPTMAYMEDIYVRKVYGFPAVSILGTAIFRDVLNMVLLYRLLIFYFYTGPEVCRFVAFFNSRKSRTANS